MNRKSLLFISVMTVAVAISCNVLRKKQPAVLPAVAVVEDTTGDSQYTGILFNENIRRTTAQTPEQERLGFKLPPGFEIQLFAAEPEIGKPINISFDARGRMWVSQSFEYPFPARSPAKPKDRITILEDTNGDGRADKFTHFNDTLNIPIGILPVNDGAISYSIPYVYRFADNNADGKADITRKLLGPFGFVDTHGMVNNFLRGLDGWVYSCHGFTNLSTISGTDGHTISMRSGNTFRFKTDGSRVEQTTTGRINPFGLVYDEMGYMYSTDCHTSPLYQLIRGGDYTGWGLEEGMGFAPDMKPLENEATALAGIAYYSDQFFPQPYQKNFYIGDVVASRVYRNSFTNKGTSPVGKKEADFVKSRDPWFRPVDVKMGPDGALYIADFYNSIIGHYEVPLDDPRRDRVSGRIWRVTYKGQHNPAIDFTKASIDELLAALNMQNMPVRMLAADQLSDRIGQAATAPLAALLSKKSTSSRQYVHALWVLYRLNALSGDMIRKAAAKDDAFVRLHTMRILLEKNPEENLFSIVSTGMQDANPHVRRASLEVLVKYPGMRSLQLALAFRQSIASDDSHLIYTDRLEIRNQLRHDSLMQQVVSKNWSEADATSIADVLLGVPSEGSGIFLAKFIENHAVPAAKIQASYQHVTRFLPASMLEKAMEAARQKYGSDKELAYLTLKGIRQGLAQRGGEEFQAVHSWGAELAASMLESYPATSTFTKDTDIEKQRFAVELAGIYRVFAAENRLRQFLNPAVAVNLNTRTEAIRALVRMSPDRHIETAASLLNDPLTGTDFKSKIAALLGDYTGSPNEKVATAAINVLGDIRNAPPEMQEPIVMSLAGTAQGKDVIFRKVRNGELMARILLQPKVEERLLMNISGAQKRTLQELVANVEPVNVERNRLISQRLAVFNDQNKNQQLPSIDSGRIVFTQNCSSCHKIGGQGGEVGPNLDGVSKWGPNNLAEKILDPNRNISEAFRNYTIRLKDGKVLAGLFKREEGAVMVFADVAGKEFSVSKKDIAERTASRYTLMPDNFRDRLSQGEFNAIINYLLKHKS